MFTKKAWYFIYSAIIFAGCVSFKPGRYYPAENVRNVLAISNTMYYRDGTYKCFMFTEWDTRLLEKGRWKETGNAIVVKIDSLHDALTDSWKKMNIEFTLKKRFLSHKKLFVRRKLLGKIYKVTWKFADDQSDIVIRHTY